MNNSVNPANLIASPSTDTSMLDRAISNAISIGDTVTSAVIAHPVMTTVGLMAIAVVMHAARRTTRLSPR